MILYEEIQTDIKKRIEANVFIKGEYLPNELELQRMYGVSRTTIRKAISMLIDEGILSIVRGKGTLVEPIKLRHKMSSVMSFTKLIEEQGFRPFIKDITVDKTKVSKEAALKLQISDDEDVYRISRIRTIEDEPISMNVSYLPCKIFTNFNSDMLYKEQSLYKLMEEAYSIMIHATEDELTAIKAKNEHINILKVKRNDPLLCMKRVAFDDSNRPVEYGEILIRSDRFKYIIALRK